MERRFPDAEHETPALFHHDVGGARDQRIARPVRDLAIVFTLHGSTIIPIVTNDPLESAAPWSVGACTSVARRCTCSTE